MKMKHYVVSLDGVDKAGKSLIVKYLARMSNYTLNILDRGPVTNIVWNKIQNRDVTYDLEMWKTAVFVHLKVDEEDWKARCSINDEPPMPMAWKQMTKAYEEQFAEMKQNGFIVEEVNTTQMTPYNVARKILDFLACLNSKD